MAIRDKIKLYGEASHQRTCKTNEIMTEGKCIVSNGDKNIILHNSNKKGILITDSNGNASFFAVPDGPAGYNKLLAVDINGNLIWVDR